MRELNVPTIRELLDNGAEKFGDRPFIKYVDDNGETAEKSYIQVRSDALAICRYLRNIGTGMHIAITGKTSYHYIVWILGVLASGNVAIPFSPEISVNEAVLLFTDADISIMVSEPDFSDKAAEINAQCDFIAKTITTNEETLNKIRNEYSDSSSNASLSEFEVNKDDCIAIIFTSGTTGKRKGAMLSTNSLVGNVLYSDYCKALGEGEVSLCVLPMYHVFSFSGDCIRNLRDGVTVCLNGDLRTLAANIRRFEPTVMRVVPMIAQSLLQRINSMMARNPDVSLEQAKVQVFGKNLRWIISGGAYLNPEIAEGYDKLGIYLRQGYGMTEAGCRISVPDENVALDSVGRVVDIADVRIQDGEIQVKTPSAMLGYYKMPEESAEVFTDDGWIHTGDIGYVTEDRQLFITGRLKNLIILSGGENVSPEAIEKKFAAFPEITEILVYAENDRIIADIYPDYDYCEIHGIEDVEADINELVKKMNASAKASHFISEVRLTKEPLEKTESGKIKRKETKII